MRSPAGIVASSVERAGGGSSLDLTFRHSSVFATDAGGYTFAAFSIGAASATRRVIVALTIGASGAAALTTATIGGVAATVDFDSLTSANNRRLYFISAVVPTGTTADVVVNFDTTIGRCGIGAWTIADGAATGETDLIDTTTLSGTLTVATSAGDAVIAAGISSGQSGIAYAWTGATERYDELIETTLGHHSGADKVATGASTSISFTQTPGGLQATPKAAIVYAA